MFPVGEFMEQMNTHLAYAAQVRPWIDAVNYYKAEVQKMQKRIDNLNLSLAIECARDIGGRARFDAFEKYHPDSPLLKPSGKKFMDGTSKTIIRVIYEQAFDEEMKSRGRMNPAIHRES